jgi:hypothetical protein
MKNVHVVVTAEILGKTLVVPFSHDRGLQFFVQNRQVTESPVVYQVPSYEVRIEGGSQYSAVRFGLQNKGFMPPPTSWRCDAGLSAEHHCTPTWVPGYSPHSFTGTSRPGAWRLLLGRGFLIHEGADTTLGQVGGSLGCIEILDGEWNTFLGEIERIGGAPCAGLGNAGRLKVDIEAAALPMATLVTQPLRE